MLTLAGVNAFLGTRAAALLQSAAIAALVLGAIWWLRADARSDGVRETRDAQREAAAEVSREIEKELERYAPSIDDIDDRLNRGLFALGGPEPLRAEDPAPLGDRVDRPAESAGATAIPDGAESPDLRPGGPGDVRGADAFSGAERTAPSGGPRPGGPAYHGGEAPLILRPPADRVSRDAARWLIVAPCAVLILIGLYLHRRWRSL